MRKITLLLVINFAIISLVAQNFNWAKREGAYAYDFGYAITHDNLGNIYTAGKYEIGANFSGTVLPLQGGHDIFVAKYNSSGTLIWIRTGGGPLGDYAHAIACDGTNFIYVAGEIEGLNDTVIFPGSPMTLHPKGDNDVFLCKYDLNGNLLWVKSAGNFYNDKALGVTYDNSGNVYITGKFTSLADFDTTTIYSYGNEDIFIAKYDANGNFLWVKKAGSAQNDDARAMKCDGAGNIYICGTDSTGTTFGSGTLTSQGDHDIFLAKYKSNGTLSWVKTAGGSGTDIAWGLDLDNNGKIFISGEYNSTASFGNMTVAAVGKSDVFVACYDTSGNAQWVKSAGGTLVDRARALGSDGQNVYITGQFGTSAVFGSNTLTAPDSSDVFIASLSNNGNYLWSVSIGGPPDPFDPQLGLAHGFESGTALCAEPSGNLYVTGSILNGGVLGSLVLSPYDHPDVFITSMSTIIGIKEIPGDAGEIRIYPNPGDGNFTLNVNTTGEKTEITVFDYQGKLLKRKNISSSESCLDLCDLNKGIYAIEIMTNEKISRQKVVIQ